MKKIVRLTESDLARIVRRVINEELTDCSKFQVITESEFLNDVKNMKFGPGGSDTEEAKRLVAKSKTIYKFNGTSEEANKNLSCIGLTLYKSKNYDYYEPNLFSSTKSNYIYIGKW